MFQLIKNYITRMTKEDVAVFARKNGIDLNESELDFTYRFVKKNYEALYANPNVDLTKYKCHFTEENWVKITKLITECKSKYLGL